MLGKREREREAERKSLLPRKLGREAVGEAVGIAAALARQSLSFLFVFERHEENESLEKAMTFTSINDDARHIGHDNGVTGEEFLKVYEREMDFLNRVSCVGLSFFPKIILK